MGPAQVNFYCPEQRAAFMLRPCEGFWEKIAKAREKWPNHQFNFPLNKCEGCKGDKLILPPDEKVVGEYEKSKGARTAIIQAIERLIEKDGLAAKADIATAIGFTLQKLEYHLAKMIDEKLLVQCDGFPARVTWANLPEGAPLPDKAVEVRKKEEIPEIVQEKAEKVEIVQEVEPPGSPQQLTKNEEKCAPVDEKETKGAMGLQPTRAVESRLCKNDDGRPAHKTSPYCLECCRENLKKNNAKAGSKPPSGLLAKFPDFDGSWPLETQLRWFDIFQEMIKA